MPNIAYFEIPADNVDRAKHFYQSLFDWKIDPIDDARRYEYHGIPEYYNRRTGGRYPEHRRYTQTADARPDHVLHVEEFEKTPAKSKTWRKFIMPKTEIGPWSRCYHDTEDNVIGLWGREGIRMSPKQVSENNFLAIFGSRKL
jgi:predicted enzyme related to lactoylglutathione lyase